MSETSDDPKTTSEIRDFAEKNIERARGALGSFLDKARKGLDTLQTTTQTSQLPAGVALARGLEYAEKNVAAAFENAQKLVRVTDVKEAIKLQSDFLKEQSAALKAQAEELTELVKPTKTENS